ncbi:hypothetical protein GCM10027614_35820 [Micromonospora vulcania]
MDTDENGIVELNLPEGVWSAMSFLNVTGSHGPNSLGLALLGDPDIDLRQDTTIRLDGKAARRIESSVPQQTADTFTRLDYYRSQGEGRWRSFLEGTTFYDSFWAQPTSKDVRNGDFYLGARWRKEQPVLSVGTTKVNFDDVVRQQGTTQLPKGRWTLSAVFAGNGAASDYTGVNARGKVVVVRHNADVSNREQAAAATAAGAKLMLVVNDHPWREVRDYSIDFFTDTPIEVALLSTDEGEALIRQIQRESTKVEVVSQPVADYVYDLVQGYHNRIPRDMIRTETAKTLARVDVGFNFPSPETRGGEFRYDWPTYNDWGIGLSSNRPLAPVRTDWVSTDKLYTWGQEAYIGSATYQIDPRTTYRAGSRNEEQFFHPIERPHLNNNFKLPKRSGDALNLDVPGWGGDDHVGMAMNSATQTNQLYQGSTLLGESTSTWINSTAPNPGELPYRLVVKTTQDPTAGPYSTSTETQWKFRSKAPAAVWSTGWCRCSNSTTRSTPTPPASRGPDRPDRLRRAPARCQWLRQHPAGHPGYLVRRRGALAEAVAGPFEGRILDGEAAGAEGREVRLAAGQRRDSSGNSVDQTVLRAFGVR